MTAGRRRIFVALLAATAGLYLAMVLWTLPEIGREAGGLAPFDLRPFGYTPAEAEVFLAALSDRGRAVYRGIQHVLDTGFPPALAAVTIWSVLLLWRGRWRLALVGLAVVGAAADLGENLAVARLLDGFDPGTAVLASRLTVVKSAASTVVYAAILAGLIRLAWRRVRG